MSSLLRSTRAKLFSSSPSSLSRTFPSPPPPSSPSPTPFSSRTFSLHSSSPLSLRTQIGALAPLLERFHRHTATTSIANENPLKGNLTSLPKPGGGEFGKFYSVPSINDFGGVPAVVDAMNNKLGSDSNKINPLRYKASGQETIVLAGAGYGNGSSRYWAAKGPMLLGVDAVIAKSFVRHYASGVPSETSEIKPHILRPLSPHLPIYKPQLSSTSSIFNRISGAFLANFCLSPVLSSVSRNSSFSHNRLAMMSQSPEHYALTEVERTYFDHGGILPYVMRNVIKQWTLFR